MRLWSIDPKYLDPKGLVALWREALLAQKVLQGKTKGYKYHPELIRFKQHQNPLKAIASYLKTIKDESVKRGYKFDQRKIPKIRSKIPIPVTKESIEFEFQWLKKKLKKRDPNKYKELLRVTKVQINPFFKINTA